MNEREAPKASDANPIKGPRNPFGYTGIRSWVGALAIVPILALTFAALFAVKHGVANSQPKAGQIVVGKNAQVVDPKDVVAQPKESALAVPQGAASPVSFQNQNTPTPASSLAPPNLVNTGDLGSGVGAGTEAGSIPAAAPVAAAPAAAAVPAAPPTLSPAQIAHEREVDADRAALEAPLVVSTIEPQAVTSPTTVAPASPSRGGYWLRRGMKIAATLYTSIDSTVPGLIVAYIPADRPVWDFGHHVVVVPGGAKLVGSFGGNGFGVAQGQARIPVSFDEIQLGDRVIALNAEPGIDRTGTSGLGARVDNHTRATFEAFTILAATALMTKSNSCTNCEQSGSSSVGSTILQSGTQLLPRPGQIPPTLHVSEGAQVAIMLKGEFQVQPWQP